MNPDTTTTTPPASSREDLDDLLRVKARLLELKEKQPMRARALNRQLAEIETRIEQAQGQQFLF